MRYTSMLAAALVSSLAGPAAADSYSPYAEQSFPTRILWGDTHVHTSYSTTDAYVAGANTVDPSIAYRFARGERVTAFNGMPVRIRRPLDFLVIADHAGGLGLAFEMAAGDQDLLASDVGKAMAKAWAVFDQDPSDRQALLDFRAAARGELPEKVERSIWQNVVERAEEYNDPGRFTTLIGYEWTSAGTTPGRRGNLHRVVVFRDGEETLKDVLPFSAYDSLHPEDLWAALARYKADTGGDVIAIPHNSNLSNGEMFARTQSDGAPLSLDWVTLRNEIEVLAEATQQKGDSEAHPILSPTDEFADFENWNSWAGYTNEPGDHVCCRDRQEPDFDAAALAEMKRGEYLRPALKTGLDIASRFGVNPYKFGIIGSTDTHTSLASADNDNFWGQYPNTPPTATRPMDLFVSGWERPLQWETAAGGYAAVWAEDNTRSAIFAAMKRREVYATTGPRITVRVFGGWDFSPADSIEPDIARVGYTRGVPMGADLPAAPGGGVPTFLLAALRDPTGANLDRIQIVKGWRDASGDLHETIHDVALSDGRRVGRGGKVRPVGSTVDVRNAGYRNSIGEPQLTAFWRDPGFDAAQHAFYYVRVLEIPTPRWPAYDARYFGVESYPDEVLMVTQERAYTSPIWYTPAP